MKAFISENLHINVLSTEHRAQKIGGEGKGGESFPIYP